MPPTAAGRRSSATRRITRRATCSRRFAGTGDERRRPAAAGLGARADRAHRRARRHRARPAGAGGAAAPPVQTSSSTGWWTDATPRCSRSSRGCALASSCARGRAASRRANGASPGRWARRRRWPGCAATTTTPRSTCRASSSRRRWPAGRAHGASSASSRRSCANAMRPGATPKPWPDPPRATSSRRISPCSPALAVPVPAAPAFPWRLIPSAVGGEVMATPAVARAGRFAILNPGAAWPNKRWPPERFGALAARLGAACGLPSVITWGGAERAARRGRCRARRGARHGLAGDDAERPARPVAPGQPRGERRHRSAAPRRLGGRAAGRAVRADAPAAQRPVAARRRIGVAIGDLCLLPQAAVPARSAVHRRHRRRRSVRGVRTPAGAGASADRGAAPDPLPRRAGRADGRAHRVAVAADAAQPAARGRARRRRHGAARVGGRSRREEPRGDLERPVPLHAPSAVPRLDAARPGHRRRGESPVARPGGRRPTWC